MILHIQISAFKKVLLVILVVINQETQVLNMLTVLVRLVPSLFWLSYVQLLIPLKIGTYKVQSNRILKDL